MKNVLKPLNLKMFFTLLVFNFIQLTLWAQDESGASTTTSTKKIDVSVASSDNWYASPWVWIVGAAAFILLLVALMSGNKGSASTSNTDRVTVKKTVERDTDI